MSARLSLRSAIAAAVSVALAVGALTACQHDDPSIQLDGVDFVTTGGVHFPSTLQGSSYLLPSGLAGQVRLHIHSEVRYPRCTVDFDGRAELPMSVAEDARNTQTAAKPTGPMVARSKVSGSITCVRDTAGSVPQTSRFTASVTPTPMITATPQRLSFGAVAVGVTSPAARVTVASTGSAPATITALQYPRDSYGIDTDTCTGRTLRVGTSCSFRIFFAPKTPNAVTRSDLRILLGAGALVTPEPIGLDASIDLGYGDFTPSSSSLEFDGVAVGSSVTKTLTVTNTGTGSLYVKRLTIADGRSVHNNLQVTSLPDVTSYAYFTITDDQCAGRTLAPQETCQTRVTFAPATPTSPLQETFLLYMADNTVTLNPLDSD